MKNIKSELFDLHFTLWRNGGPDFLKEKAIWDAWQDDEWHLVTNSRKSYATTVKSAPSHSVFTRLHYPSNYFVKNFSQDANVR